MKISCSFCDKTIEISEYEYALWSKGEGFYCEECLDKFERGINQTRKIS